MEQYNLAITTANTNLIICNCLDALDALCADILREDQNLILDLEAAEVAALGTSKQEFLSWLTEGKAAVVSHKCPSVYKFWLHLTIGGIKRPQIKFLGSANGELILGSVS